MSICAFCNKVLRNDNDKGICAKCEDDEKARERELRYKFFTYHDTTKGHIFR